MSGWIVAVSGRCAAVSAALACTILSGCQDVTVMPVDVASVQLAPDSITLLEGETQPLLAVVRERGGQILEGRPVSWSSEDPAVASVSGDGVVEAVTEGNTVIRASAEGVAGTASVLVLPGPSIELPPAISLSARRGREETVSVNVTNGGNGTLSGLESETEMDDAPDSDWLQGELEDSDAPTRLRLVLSARGLEPGEYRGRVLVRSAAARNSPQALEVTFEVLHPSARLSVNPSSVALLAVSGQPDAATQVVSIENVGEGELEPIEVTIQPASARSWLVAELDGPAAPAELTLRASARDLDPCTCRATVEVASPAADNVSEDVDVRFTVSESSARGSGRPRPASPDV